MILYSKKEQLAALSHAYERMDFHCLGGDEYRHKVKVIEAMLKVLEFAQSDGPEKDVVRGMLECLKCGAMIEFYENASAHVATRTNEMKSEMIYHLTNDCRVP